MNTRTTKLLVQKYGGSSVANIDRIKKVAERVASWYRDGYQLVVVVSAMQGVTDSLIDLAKQITPLPPEREMDVLLSTGEQTTIALMAISLYALGIPAISLTGAQAGIVTDGVHTKARILHITPKQIFEYLDRGYVVVVAGFQGQTLDGHITTLGRGGSDLTAIALAAALKADMCQIYTDVDGVYTADPRVVPNARKLDEISYDELLELAGSGAKVMQLRSVEFAKKFNVVFEVRSSMTNNPGTIVKEETRNMEDVVVRGVGLDKNQAKVTVIGVPDRPGVAARIFTALAKAAISVDMIVQNVSHDSPNPVTDISFTVEKADLAKAAKVIEELRPELNYEGVTTNQNVAKLSIVGVGMRSHSGVAARLFEVLAREQINIDMISTSEIKVSVLIDSSRAEEAARKVHEAFIEKPEVVY